MKVPTVTMRAKALERVRWEVEKAVQAFDLYRETRVSLFLDAFLVHARVLSAFFSQSRPYDDDVLCADFGFPSPTADVLSIDIRRAINARLAHLSYERAARATDWNTSRLFAVLFETCAAFARHVETAPDGKVFCPSETAHWKGLEIRLKLIAAKA